MAKVQREAPVASTGAKVTKDGPQCEEEATDVGLVRDLGAMQI